MILSLPRSPPMSASGKDVESVAVRLEDDVSGALDWFKSNKMVANLQKF